MIQNSQKTLCINNKQADHVCMNQLCQQKPAFICKSKNCDCRKQHSKCLNVFLFTIKNKTQSKIKSLKHIQDSIQKQIQKTADDLSNFKQCFKKKTTQKLQKFLLSPTQQKVYKAIINQSQQRNQLTGKDIWQLSLIHQNQSDNQHQKESFKNSTLKIWKNFNTGIKNLIQKTMLSLQKLNENQHQNDKRMFHCSQIIYFDQLQKRMLQFFSLIKPKSAVMLYKASQNSFGIDEFYEKCNGVVNILILMRTQYGKLIGGFSSSTFIQSWIQSRLESHKQKVQLQRIKRLQDEKNNRNKIKKSSKSNKKSNKSQIIIIQSSQNSYQNGFNFNGSDQNKHEYMNMIDYSESSFIFSLTNNDKFQLLKKEPAISRLSQSNKKSSNESKLTKGVIFGKHILPDLVIIPQADKFKSQINLCHSYKNQNYQSNNKNSNKRFCGSQDGKFIIKEWQAWEIKFS